MSGSMKISLKFDVSGPLADSTAEKVVTDWQQATAKALGDRARDLLAAFPMNKTGRARGGFQRNLNVVQKALGTATVAGPQITGVTWASWLQGTSKRNSSTKFKGYRLFTKTRLQVSKEAPGIAQEQLDKLMPKIGGE